MKAAIHKVCDFRARENARAPYYLSLAGDFLQIDRAGKQHHRKRRLDGADAGQPRECVFASIAVSALPIHKQ